MVIFSMAKKYLWGINNARQKTSKNHPDKKMQEVEAPWVGGAEALAAGATELAAVGFEDWGSSSSVIS